MARRISRHPPGTNAVEALFTMANRNSSFPFLYSGSLVTQGTRTPWGGLWRFEFDRGTVIADNIDGQYGLYLASDGRYKFLCAFADESMAFDKSFKHFHDSIKNGKEAWSSGADNLNTLRNGLEFYRWRRVNPKSEVSTAEPAAYSKLRNLRLTDYFSSVWADQRVLPGVCSGEPAIHF
jgi:predicted dehydrogenase